MADKTEIPPASTNTTSAETNNAQGQPTDSNQPPPPVQPNPAVYTQPPPYGQPPGFVQQTAYGQPIVITQPGVTPYGQPVGQAVVLQNQYGQPVVMQGAVPMNVPIPIDPNNPAQNERPVSTKCLHCQQDIMTETEYAVGGCTWTWCILLALMGCIFCCFIPFFWKGSKDVIHTCPNCKAEVGRFHRQQRSNVRVHAGHGGGFHRRRRRRRRR